MSEEEEEEHLSNSPNPDTEITENPSQQEYLWPAIRFDVPPQRTYHFSHQFRTASNPNNFLKGVKWYLSHLNLYFNFKMKSCSFFFVCLGRRMVLAFLPVLRTTPFVLSHCKFSFFTAFVFY